MVTERALGGKAFGVEVRLARNAFLGPAQPNNRGRARSRRRSPAAPPSRVRRVSARVRRLVRALPVARRRMTAPAFSADAVLQHSSPARGAERSASVSWRKGRRRGQLLRRRVRHTRQLLARSQAGHTRPANWKLSAQRSEKEVAVVRPKTHAGARSAAAAAARPPHTAALRAEPSWAWAARRFEVGQQSVSERSRGAPPKALPSRVGTRDHQIKRKRGLRSNGAIRPNP